MAAPPRPWSSACESAKTNGRAVQPGASTRPSVILQRQRRVSMGQVASRDGAENRWPRLAAGHAACCHAASDVAAWLGDEDADGGRAKVQGRRAMLPRQNRQDAANFAAHAGRACSSTCNPSHRLRDGRLEAQARRLRRKQWSAAPRALPPRCGRSTPCAAGSWRQRRARQVARRLSSPAQRSSGSTFQKGAPAGGGSGAPTRLMRFEAVGARPTGAVAAAGCGPAAAP